MIVEKRWMMDAKLKRTFHKKVLCVYCQRETTLSEMYTICEYIYDFDYEAFEMKGLCKECLKLWESWNTPKINHIGGIKICG
jgi:hypothetical protein